MNPFAIQLRSAFLALLTSASAHATIALSARPRVHLKEIAAHVSTHHDAIIRLIVESRRRSATDEALALWVRSWVLDVLACQRQLDRTPAVQAERMAIARVLLATIEKARAVAERLTTDAPPPARRRRRRRSLPVRLTPLPSGGRCR